MSDMVERVAKAQAGPRWDAFDEEHKSAARDLARVAIEAMREPTDAMDDAARTECHRMAGCLDPVVHIWDVMIDAALSGPHAVGAPE